MKTIDEITRQRICAMYWAQPIFTSKTHHEMGPLVENALCLEFMHGLDIEGALLVTPLSAISDEDAIEVAKMFYPASENWSSKMHKADEGVRIIELTLLSGERGEFSVFGIDDPCYKLSHLIDYLRSKGYALPAYGYSVDELIEAGIFKLKTKEG